MDTISKKIVFFGDPDTGKTFLLVSIFYNNINYKITYPSEWSYTTVVNDKQVRLTLCDGRKFFPSHFSDCDIVVLCFSIDDPTSLKNIEELWMPLIRQNHSQKPVILVANKVDLRSDGTIQSTNLTNHEDGRKMAAKIGACCYFECSAETRDNIEELVGSLVEIVVKMNSTTSSQQKSQKKKKNTCRIS